MSKERDKLLDMSVGKAGDLYKWQVAITISCWIRC